MNASERTAGNQGRSTPVHRVPPLTGLLAFCFVVNLLTMPSFFYRGDNAAPRAECRHLLERGHLGIVSDDPSYGGFITGQEEGQYFYRHPVTGRYHSKYGLANTLAYIPPLLAYRLQTGRLHPIDNPDLLLFFVCLNNSFFMLLGVFYMHRIAALYSGRASVRVISVLLACYTTFLWHYLRAPALEIYQIGPFLGVCYHLIAYLRQTSSTHAARSLGVSLAWLMVLVFFKLFFFVLAGAIVVAVLLKRMETRRMADCANVVSWRTLAFLFIALVTIVVCVQTTNLLRFGSFMSTGYEQWRTSTGDAVDRFSISNLPASLSGLFLIPGNSNVFAHFPLVLLCFLAWPSFLRRYRYEGVLLVAIVAMNLIPVCSFSSWAGAWSYGPRYTIHLLVIASVPGVLGLDWLIGTTRHRMLRVAIWTVLILVTGTSLALQVVVNGMHYFAEKDLRAKFQERKCEQANAYFENRWHTGLVAWDLRNHRNGKREFPPLTMVADQEAHAHQRSEGAAVRDFWLAVFVKHRSSPNYMLCSLRNKEYPRQTTEKTGLTDHSALP